MSVRAAKFQVDSDEYVVVSYSVTGRLGNATALSPGEREVTELLLSGCSYREIAERRNRSVRTIANQIASAFKKLGVSSRAELAALGARRSG